MQIKKVSMLLALVFCCAIVRAQEQPFYREIQHFKKEDSLHFPAKNGIVFLGSSSFRKWTDVQQAFPGYPIINRGFGGSTIPDAIRYLHKIVFPYAPRQVVIYEGDNDLASYPAVTPDSVLHRFEKLFYLLRKRLPQANISFVSIKPSLSREKLIPQMEKANSLIKSFLKDKKNTHFIDVFHAMLDKNGKPIDGIFAEDGLHMNARGYAIWQRIIKPYLLKK